MTPHHALHSLFLMGSTEMFPVGWRLQNDNILKIMLHCEKSTWKKCSSLAQILSPTKKVLLSYWFMRRKVPFVLTVLIFVWKVLKYEKRNEHKCWQTHHDSQFKLLNGKLSKKVMILKQRKHLGFQRNRSK